MIGRRPAVVSWFEAWGSSTSVTGEIISSGLLDSVTERGAIPMITWEPWDPAAGVDQPTWSGYPQASEDTHSAFG
jgi:hypothetical protein